MSQKGSSFERETCTRFSKWWSNGAQDDVFWRTAGSGARATSRFKKGKLTAAQDGDMQAVDERGKPFTSKFTVEMKRGYKSWSVMDVLDKSERMRPQTFEAFIAQAKMAAQRKGTWPMLVAKRDQRLPIVVIPRQAYAWLVDRCGSPAGNQIRLVYSDESWHLTTLDDFFTWVQPEAFNDKRA